jgi:poly-gamma-glutamate capsule biosynthesis protein CapA/YwtB (metallophosphatase superfamily)
VVVPKRALSLRATAAGALVLACAAAAAAVALTGARAAARDLAAQKVTGWRAPGVRIPVKGWGPADATVVLRAETRVVDTTTAGPQGLFRLAFTTLRPGRYPLSVETGTETLNAGTVRIRPVTVAAVGDITFGEQVGPTLDRVGGRYPWTSVAPLLRRADVTTGNLETAVSTRGTPAVKQYTFRGAPWMLRTLHSYAGFDVLTLANNHAVDFGRGALLDTVHAVRAAGMQTIGAGANAWRARRPAIVTSGGLRIAFLGYSDVNPPGFTAAPGAPGTARADPVEITADVHAALRRADVAVCFFHWGVEVHARPDSRQEELAAACLRAGASLVLGAHPHVFGPIVRPSRHTLVAWTLGNFVFPSSGVTAHTGIFEVRLGADGVEGYGKRPVTIEGFRPVLR